MTQAGGAPGAPRINVIGSSTGNDQVTMQLATMKSSSDQKHLSPNEYKKLEDSLRDHVDILQTMNAKLNNHIGQQNEFKAYMADRIDKIEHVTLNREIEKIPSKYEMLQMDQSLKRLHTDLESIRND